MLRDAAVLLGSLATSLLPRAVARAVIVLAAGALTSAVRLDAAESASKAASPVPAATSIADELKPVEPFEWITSEFVDDPAIGKDPFFPLSKRREAKVLAPVVGGPSPTLVLLNQVTLKGISGTQGRRLALITNRSFEVGEVGDVRLPGGKVLKIRCLEIGARSVVIEVDGSNERKEISLREGL